MNQLMLHCGGRQVDFAEVCAVPTPPSTDTHYPIPHEQYVTQVKRVLQASNYEISSEVHGLNADNQRYFGLVTLKNKLAERPFEWAVGLRNSHDKSVSARMAVGTRVFVCDNLSFGGEITVTRKHTKFAKDDLQRMLTTAIGNLNGYFIHEDTRWEAYKTFTVSDEQAHDLMVRAVAAKAISGLDILPVNAAWEDPEHEEFQPRTMWSLFNAFTGRHGELRNANTAIRRGESLRGLLDSVVGLEPWIPPKEGEQPVADVIDLPEEALLPA